MVYSAYTTICPFTQSGLFMSVMVCEESLAPDQAGLAPRRPEASAGVKEFSLSNGQGVRGRHSFSHPRSWHWRWADCGWLAGWVLLALLQISWCHVSGVCHAGWQTDRHTRLWEVGGADSSVLLCETEPGDSGTDCGFLPVKGNTSFADFFFSQSNQCLLPAKRSTIISTTCMLNSRLLNLGTAYISVLQTHHQLP